MRTVQIVNGSLKKSGSEEKINCWNNLDEDCITSCSAFFLIDGRRSDSMDSNNKIECKCLVGKFTIGELV